MKFCMEVNIGSIWFEAHLLKIGSHSITLTLVSINIKVNKLVNNMLLILLGKNFKYFSFYFETISNSASVLRFNILTNFIIRDKKKS